MFTVKLDSTKPAEFQYEVYSDDVWLEAFPSQEKAQEFIDNGSAELALQTIDDEIFWATISWEE